MAYIIEKKQGKQIYLYQVESYWDKEKKQARQKRKYIGKKVEKQEQTQQANIKYEAKDYGQIYLIKQIAKEIGLDKILKEVFRDKCEEILEITYYDTSTSFASFDLCIQMMMAIKNMAEAGSTMRPLG